MRTAEANFQVAPRRRSEVVGSGRLTLTAAKRASPSIPPVAIPRGLRRWQPARPCLGGWSLRSARGRRDLNPPGDPLPLSRVLKPGAQQPRPPTAPELGPCETNQPAPPHSAPLAPL